MKPPMSRTEPWQGGAGRSPLLEETYACRRPLAGSLLHEQIGDFKARRCRPAPCELHVKLAAKRAT